MLTSYSEMASLKTLLIVKLLTLWNYIRDITNALREKFFNFFYYMKDYFHGHHDTWLFIPGHTVPLSLSNLYNMVHVNWIYDNFDNILTIGGVENIDTNCSFSWLSAKIRVIHFDNPDSAYDYDIDDFLQKFRVRTKHDIAPSLYEVFLCWCTYTKHWFKTNDIIEFHIIDDMADEIVLSLDDVTKSLAIRNNKLYVHAILRENQEGIEAVD